MRVLILGGTGFIGPHFVRAAVDRGHRVSVFNRGRQLADLPLGVEILTGDRDGELESIKHRGWDAVFDLATYVPNRVRTLGQALRGRVRHYTFISTIMVYRFPGAGDEQSELQVYDGCEDPYALREPGRHYGPLKVLCEREAELQFPQSVLAIRPGHIVGPGERSGLFTYLVARLEQGGEILAGGDPLTLVQLIDVRDLAEWAVSSAETGRTGAFTVTGPALPLTWSELLGGIRAVFSVPTRLIWVSLPWLFKRGLQPSSCLLFWPSQMGIPGFTELKVAKAIANGLNFRSLSTTVMDTLAWYRSQSVELQRAALAAFDSNNKALADSMAREKELLAAWHACK
jgi:2'-hydroxyisoflavone reductase